MLNSGISMMDAHAGRKWFDRESWLGCAASFSVNDLIWEMSVHKPVPRRVWSPETLKWLAPTLLLFLAAGCGESGPVDPQAQQHTPSDQAEWFTEITHEVKLDFQHESGVDGSYLMPQIVGSGGALFDYDNDGDLDIYLVNSGSHSPATSIPSGPTNSLFSQEADGTFLDRTRESGLGDAGYGMGTAVGDIDNDGDLDVYVTNYGHDALYRNDGSGTFSNITALAGISGEHWSTSAAFLDYDRDGYLDLYVTNYVSYDPPKVCTDKAGRPEFCGPAAFRGVPDVL